MYFTNETGSCKTTVQFWQKVHGVDITHDNVCSSMLSCFYSHLLSTGRPISSLLNMLFTEFLVSYNIVKLQTSMSWHS